MRSARCRRPRCSASRRSSLPLLTSGLVTPWGLLRAGADLVLPRRALPADPTIAELLRYRLGDQVFDRLVDPMLGGVHAGRADRLSARSAVPEVMSILDGARSVYLTMKRREKKPASGPALVSLPGGMARLLDALVAACAGADLRTDSPVTADHARHRRSLRRDARRLQRRSAPTTSSSRRRRTPRPRCSPSSRPTAAVALASIEYVDVATVMLSYRTDQVRRPLDRTGFLVPPVDGRFLVGCSWLTTKWGHLAHDTRVVLRAMVGRDGDRRWLAMTDDEMVSAIHTELVTAIGVTDAPLRGPRAALARRHAAVHRRSRRPARDDRRRARRRARHPPHRRGLPRRRPGRMHQPGHAHGDRRLGRTTLDLTTASSAATSTTHDDPFVTAR